MTSLITIPMPAFVIVLWQLNDSHSMRGVAFLLGVLLFLLVLGVWLLGHGIVDLIREKRAERDEPDEKKAA